MIYKSINALVLGVLLGLIFAKFIPYIRELVPIALVLVLFLVIRYQKLITMLFILFGIYGGFLRVAPILTDHATIESLLGQKMEIVAQVIDDPVYHESGQYEFHVQQVTINGDEIVATLRVRGYVNDLRRGDDVRLVGKLREGFAYWQASIYYADITVINRSSSHLGLLRGDFIANTYSLLPDPEASLGLGFLIGIRSMLPEILVEQLRITGLTHIVAVSGYNLTILANLSKQIFAKFSRRTALFATVLFVLTFVTLTGLSPSILRATIVSFMTLGAWFYGRKYNPWIILLYSSSISAIIRPDYTWFHIGWHLSLAAFFGILIIAPLAKARLFGDKDIGLLKQILLETTCAQLTTLPIILFVFGEMSIISLLANAIVLPLVPIAMLLTFLTGLLSLIGSPIAMLAASCTYIFLRFMTSAISLLSELSWSVVELEINTLQMLWLVATLLFVYLVMRRKAPAI